MCIFSRHERYNTTDTYAVIAVPRRGYMLLYEPLAMADDQAASRPAQSALPPVHFAFPFQGNRLFIFISSHHHSPTVVGAVDWHWPTAMQAAGRGKQDYGIDTASKHLLPITLHAHPLNARCSREKARSGSQSESRSTGGPSGAAPLSVCRGFSLDPCLRL